MVTNHDVLLQIQHTQNKLSVLAVDDVIHSFLLLLDGLHYFAMCTMHAIETIKQLPYACVGSINRIIL
jgi:hypothetical protein